MFTVSKIQWKKKQNTWKQNLPSQKGITDTWPLLLGHTLLTPVHKPVVRQQPAVSVHNLRSQYVHEAHSWGATALNQSL